MTVRWITARWTSALALSLALITPALAQPGEKAVPDTFFDNGPADSSSPDGAGNAPAKIRPPNAPGIPLVQTAKADVSISPAESAQLQRINAYFNGLRVMSGHFTQLNPDGTRSTGDFWIQKPGKMRFEYDRPNPTSLIADGRSLAVRDKKMNTQSLYFLSQTPLRFLLADHIDLAKDSEVVGVSSGEGVVNVTLEESHAIGGTARIEIVFDAKTYALKQWTVTDAQGFDTVVALDIVNTSDNPPASYFKINELNR